MARPRTPTAILEFSGAFKRNPQRRKAREEEPVITTPIGDPYKRMTPHAKELWREMAEEGAAWLVSTDRALLEQVCELRARFIWSQAKAQMNRGGALKGVELTQMRIGMGQLGFSPADRARMKAKNGTPTKPASKWARFRDDSGPKDA